MTESPLAQAKFEPALFEPALRATAALTRLDERLRTSPVRDGYFARMAFHEAVACMWLGGELVHLEDLVLHDAHMDIRAPTHELTLAHQVLRTIRQVAANSPDWALGEKGLQRLRGQRSVVENLGQENHPASSKDTGENHDQTKPKPTNANTFPATSDYGFNEDDGTEAGLAEPTRDVSFAALELDRDLAEMDARLQRLDAVLRRTTNGGRAIAGGAVGEAASNAALSANGLNPLIYDDDDDAEERLSEWQTRLTATRDLPQVLRAALALDDWNRNEILPRAPWLGPVLAASMLQAESKQSGKAGGKGIALTYIPALFMGLRQLPRERRNSKDDTVRLMAMLEAFEHAALVGLKEHDRLVLARTQMQRKLKGKRTNSKMPQLIELVLSRPLVTSTIIERELKVTLQGALNLVAELGLREVTGRGRYRAWAVV